MAESSIPRFNKRLSPLCYPGGKSKVIDQLYTPLNKDKCDVLVSPFTGGGSFEFAMLHNGLVRRLHLNDLDFCLFSLWWMILYMPSELIHRISIIQPNKGDFFESRELIKSDYRFLDMPEIQRLGKNYSI
jgi:DNA adenine methylase